MDEATSINGVNNMIYDIIEAPDSADFEGSGHGTQRGYVSSTMQIKVFGRHHV